MSNKCIDLTGQRFGKLVVLRRDEEKKDSNHRVFWICQCDCGNIVSIPSQNLRRGYTKSCGCMKRNDITGKRFGRWTVIKKDKKIGRIQTYFCQCDCGNTSIIPQSNLTTGKTKSCGCLQKELLSKRVKKHGMRNSRLYDIHANMKSRCYNKNNPRYASYGGRGISICDEWLNPNSGFENFHNWAMANGYSDELTIDRMNVNGDYCPDNCRWSDQETQKNNQRKTVWVEIKGIKKSLKQWTNFMGWSYGKYSARHKRGVDIFSQDELNIIKEKLEKEKLT